MEISTSSNNTGETSEDDVKGKETTVFKVPSIGKKSLSKKEKQIASDQNPLVQKESSSTDTLDQNNENSVSSENRPKISFQPKSLTLPSQVYKPHRPSASEYIEHYYKMEKEGKHFKIQGSDSKTLSESTPDKNEPKVSDLVKAKSNAKQTKLNYTKASWSCPCEVDTTKAYSLEVLKSGAIIDKINLSTKDYFVFGRLSDCDITLEHPSISRYHAVLQFGTPTEDDDVEFQKDGSSGFYLFDLGSTHGTFLNKAPVPSKKYYRVKVGHMMKFGGSSRIYILQGPETDQEAEAKETATELAEKARAERKKKDLAKMMMGDDSDDDENDDLNEEKSSSSQKKDNDTGISWGMLEDAVVESDEENETEKNQEPILSLDDQKERFYVKDPHKALKNFYDKEGIEIDFECIEKRPGQWNVRLELPIDTPSGKAIVAEANITGKKRDAVNNCALEACRLLDKHGMFKQSERHRRKVKEWEKEDFYDSDEDQYLDRTGDLDKKRQMRKHRVGVKSGSTQDQPQTYESLKQQIDDLEREISQIEEQLEKDKKATQTKEGSSDPLEEFMKQVKSGKTLDSVTRSKLKQRLLAIRKESARLIKLADIARPVSLPPLSGQTSKSMSFIGRMKGKKKKAFLLPASLPPAPVYKPLSDENMVEEEDDDDVTEPEKVTSEKIKEDLPPIEAVSSSSIIEDNTNEETEKQIPDQSLTNDVVNTNGNKTAPNNNDHPSSPEHKSSISSEDQVKPSKRRKFGPTLPQDLKDRLLGVNQTETGDSSHPKSRKHRKKSTGGSASATQPISNDPNYADWLPPEGQTGDGTTSLNAKYGY